jgi:cytochrome c biogenesis protein CcdA/thiol-disulfide isomerase/thioredoxin
MTVLLSFAFISGMVTILSPCILPALPVILSGSVGSGKGRPFGIVTGFILGFTFFTLTLTTLVQLLGISADSLRYLAVIVLILFGAVLVIPQLSAGFQNLVSRLVHRGSKLSAAKTVFNKPGDGPIKLQARLKGFVTGLPIGLSLGLVWTPCVGPIIASVISLAVSKQIDGGSVLIVLAYSLGTAIPMLGIMLGGRALLNRVPWLSRNSLNIQRIFGIFMIVAGLAIALGWDRRVQTALLEAFPSYGSGLTAIEDNKAVQDALARRSGEPTDTTNHGLVRPTVGPQTVFSGAPAGSLESPALQDYGQMPDLVVAKGPWFNTDSLGTTTPNLASFKGKVVLVDFWTYSCINCIRTLPYLRSWYQTYQSQGFVILGIHTPEFEFEKKSTNVQTALKDLGITWPVVQDNDYSQWTSYANRYWPADYLVDSQGRVRYFHFGEGDYQNTEQIIRQLLTERGASLPAAAKVADNVLAAQTPETYLGYNRTRGFVGTPTTLKPDAATHYQAAGQLKNGDWTLNGDWTVTKQYLTPHGDADLSFEFNAKNVFLVIEPGQTAGQLQVLLDGRSAPETTDAHGGLIVPDSSRLYQLIKLDQAGEHRLQIRVHGDVRLFAFTFG